MHAKLKKYLAYIGPYPYNPYLIFLFFFALFFSRYTPLLVDLPQGLARWKAAGFLTVISLLPSAFFAGLTILLKKFRFWSASNLLYYMFEIGFALFCLHYYYPLIKPRIDNLLGPRSISLIGSSPSTFLVSLIFGLIALALMHQAERRVVERLFIANQLVEQLKIQRKSLIDAEENVRQQTSQFLHDRVQSDLMVVGMKLKSILGKTSSEVNDVVEQAILRLEETRTSELRQIVQILSPNFGAGTLQGSLDVLLERYRTSMEVTVEIDDATEALNSNVLLGIFRIIEQAILNSLVHGPASRVQITARTNSKLVTTLAIADDGPGSKMEEMTLGVGSAVIDSWVGILNGNKSVETVPGHGYLLKVQFSNTAN